MDFFIQYTYISLNFIYIIIQQCNHYGATTTITPKIDNNYEVKCVLGKGYSGTVVLAKVIKTSVKVTIKIYIQSNENTINSFNNEVTMMKKAAEKKCLSSEGE